jgi:hypothetical protein
VTFFASVEAWCADAVERFFARAFPGPLEPVQIARRLIATLEHDPPAADAGRSSRYAVRVSASDYARLEAEKDSLERQWGRMAAALCARAGIHLTHPPAVALGADADLVAGTVVIDVVHPDGDAGPLPNLRLRVERGVTVGATHPLPRPGSSDASIVVGRDAGCDVVISDQRVSRRHLRIEAGDDSLRFADLGSSNGTYLNGGREARGKLRPWDRLEIGDTIFALEPVPSEAGR